MKISDLKEGTTNVEIEATVKELGEVRQVNTRFGPREVADNILEDETGQVKLTLWGDDIQKVKIGDKVTITGGYVKAWQGDLQVGIGRNGSLNVGGAGKAADTETDATEALEEPAAEESTKESADEPAKEPTEEAVEETEIE